MFQLNVLEAIDYIRQCPDFDAIYIHTSRSQASNVDKTTVENIIGALIDRNVIVNRETMSDRTSNFNR